MANLNITSPESGKTDTLTVSISPKSMARIVAEKRENIRPGLTEETSIWYRVHNALVLAGLVEND